MTATERAAWLESRRRGIGSSDAPSLVGVGFGTALDVYESKVRPAADKRSPLLEMGNLLEPLAADEYARLMGVEVRPLPMAVHPARPWQGASADRERADGVLVECKTVGTFGPEWGDAGSDEIPPGYLVQVTHQMGVLGREMCDVAALSRLSGEFRVYRVAFDPEFFAWLTDVQERFWFGHVQTLTPPGPEWDRQFDAGIPLPAVPGKAVALGDDVAALLARRKLVGEVRKEADAEHDRLTRLVEAAMGDAERATAGGWTLKRTTVAGGPVSYERQSYVRLDIRQKKEPSR